MFKFLAKRKLNKRMVLVRSARTEASHKKISVTAKLRHGDDFYKRIGALGGANSHTGGFGADHELARTAGAKGGRISKRGKAK